MLRGVFFISPCVRRWWCCSQRSDCLGWSRRLANSNCSSNIFLTISGPVSNSRCFRDTNTASSRTLMMNSNCEKVLFFADVGVDRAIEKRTNEEWLFHAFNNPEALLVPVLESKSLIHAGKPALVSTTILSKDAIYQHERDMQPIFLGLKAGTAAPIFTVDVKKFSSTDWALHVLQEGMEWVDLRKYGPELEPPDAGLLAYACGMVHWHSRNRFCGCCGKKMLSELGGHSLKCISHSCTSSIYPRLDPAIIGLVTFGDYVLLGRQARWEQGRYSLLAGFVEVGETFELALAREVKEECGVDIDGKSVRYAGSQPWPFPSSLMVGFTAKACSSDCSSMNREHLEKCEISGKENVPTVAGHNSLPTITADTDELEVYIVIKFAVYPHYAHPIGHFGMLDLVI
ncbi:hypothetical protein O6H91_21G011500 [Diphasiastrum complanatum]|uniref:Uncharacterized protein n=1 Tax=Diphasiastrum complanatum TaxID=34168 RepID=A0ACC2AHV8_DIPCM|nr:hypothetical protein O6H91_21G011500 [Diphasiastrum complanatum]